MKIFITYFLLTGLLSVFFTGTILPALCRTRYVAKKAKEWEMDKAVEDYLRRSKLGEFLFMFFLLGFILIPIIVFLTTLLVAAILIMFLRVFIPWLLTCIAIAIVWIINKIIQKK